MRSQVELRFIIGWPTTVELETETWFRRQVINEASRLCGGCTVTMAQGHWREDGDVKKNTFDGPCHLEHVLDLSLTCETYKVETVYSAMCTYIAELVRVVDYPVNWVHVQERPITGRHFSCAKINGKEAASDTHQAWH